MQFPAQAQEILTSGGILLCANARSARTLQHLYGKQHSSNGHTNAWITPPVFELHDWLQKQWLHLLMSGTESRLLLTPVQEEILWTEIVRPETEAHSLIAPEKVAHLAAEAYQLLCRYRATHLITTASWNHQQPEAEAFRRWALKWERRCHQSNWLPSGKLIQAIEAAFEQKTLLPPPQIGWVGFDRVLPEMQQLRGTIASLNCQSTEISTDTSAITSVVEMSCWEDEITACAQWAKAQLVADPSARLAVLVPDLETSRAEIDRIFRRVLSFEQENNLLNPELPFEFTLGLPLADVPAIAAALHLLTWCTRAIERSALTSLLTGGFFASAGAADQLATADLHLRKRMSTPEAAIDQTLDQLLKLTHASGGSYEAANFVKRLRHARTMLKDLDRRLTIADWIAQISSFLQKTGWPGDRQIASTEYQALERWQSALEELARADAVGHRCDYPRFLELLHAHLRRTIFSAKERNASVTVSGIFESAGISFDAAWVLHATDELWPSKPRPHPFLPFPLQKSLQMPGTDHREDMRFAEVVQSRLAASSAHLTFSYAVEGQKTTQRPSTLLSGIPVERGTIPEAEAEPATSIFADEVLVPWKGGEVLGGQSVLKLQSACPFRAFAATRLGARSLPSEEPGLSAADRGSILHNALHTLWADARMQNSANLRALIASQQVPVVVREHVSEAFHKYETSAPTDWERSYLQLEQERVCSLIEEWLRKESARKPFAVEEREREATIEIVGLPLKVRLDRIDRLEEGRAIIDYKTGKVSAKSLEGDRPEEPQLLMYAVGAGVKELRDVALAKIRANEMCFVSPLQKGGDDLCTLPPEAAKKDFSILLERWESTLATLSLEFQQGLASPKPRSYPKTCEFCDYPGLCRIAESATDITEADNEPA